MFTMTVVSAWPCIHCVRQAITNFLYNEAVKRSTNRAIFRIFVKIFINENYFTHSLVHTFLHCHSITT